jgi:hypothetical protein
MCTCSGSCNCNSTTIPKGPQGATGATGAQGIPGLPGDNGNYVVQTVEPAGANCFAGGVKIEVFNGVDDTLINTTYVCNSYIEGFFGLAQPDDLNAAPASPSTIRRVIDGDIQLLTTEVYDDQNAYNPVNGVWTCPETGRYDLSFYVHYQSPGAEWTEGGYFIAGICTASTTDVYVASTHFIGSETLYVEISGSFSGLVLTSGTQLVLKVINCTEDNYISKVGDIVKMSMRKVG